MPGTITDGVETVGRYSEANSNTAAKREKVPEERNERIAVLSRAPKAGNTITGQVDGERGEKGHGDMGKGRRTEKRARDERMDSVL